PGPLDLELGEGAQVVQRDALAGRKVLGADDRRPIPGGPAGARRRVRPWQAGVRLEPLGALPASALEEDGAEVGEPPVERRGAQTARVLHLLERVDDVIHLDVLLAGAGSDEPRLERVGGEAVEVALVQVEARSALGDRLGDDAADAAGMGDP